MPFFRLEALVPSELHILFNQRISGENLMFEIIFLFKTEVLVPVPSGLAISLLREPDLCQG